MASATDTLAGLLLLGDMNNADIDVSDLLDDAPVIKALAAVACVPAVPMWSPLFATKSAT